MDLTIKIKHLAQEKNAVILAHYYQNPDIQDLADFIGDSLFLAQKAAETKADIIVFCGVHFMAETAKILNPGKKVLLPDPEAGCSLAESCHAEELKLFKDKYPEHKLISYINCSAEVKALSDVICTSGNALSLVESFPKDEKIIFAPDKNLGNYINQKTGRNMVLWNGACHVHDQLHTENIIALKREHPEAKVIAHPECSDVILKLADFIGSTAAMLKFTKTDNAGSYIVATETGILHQMQKESPDKNFYIVPREESCSCNNCEYMKLNTLEKIHQCLLNEMPEINLPVDLIEKAKIPLLKMLELSK